MNKFVLVACIGLSGCTSQFAFGPAAWSAAPAIPGFTSIPLAGGGFIEEPTNALTPPAPAEPPPPDIQTVITGLDQAQKVRTLVRQLAR
jgi:hypothetical protein